MAENPRDPNPGSHTQQRGAFDSSKEALTDQLYEATFKPLLMANLEWARDNRPELHYQFCWLWHKHPWVMRNQTAFFTSIAEWFTHHVHMSQLLRNFGEGALAHLPTALHRFMGEYTQTLVFPPDFTAPSLLDSPKVLWRMLLRDHEIVMKQWPLIEKLHQMYADEGLDRVKYYLAQAATGAARVKTDFMQGWNTGEKNERQRLGLPPRQQNEGDPSQANLLPSTPVIQPKSRLRKLFGF